MLSKFLAMRGLIQKGSGGGGSTPGGGEDVPDDGKTRLFITLVEGRTSPMMGIGVSGTATVDWGDGTAPDVIVGSGGAKVQWTPSHEYSKAGDYIICISAEGNEQVNAEDARIFFLGRSTSARGSYVLAHTADADNRNDIYQDSINRICFGMATLKDYALMKCRNLKSVTMSDKTSFLGEAIFNGCFNLKFVMIPNGITTIKANTVGGCTALTSIVVPSSVTTINAYAFGNCYSVRYYDFSNCTAVPALANTSAFTGIPADCEIRVPAALYDEWIAATNWATYASQIVPV